MPTLDASGTAVLPGLIECHSHPLFAGDRHAEYAERLAGASLAEIAAAGGRDLGERARDPRRAPDAELLDHLQRAYRRILAGGVTTLEVKSGYGLTRGRGAAPARAAGPQPGVDAAGRSSSRSSAHTWCRPESEAETYTDEVLAMLPSRDRPGLSPRSTTSPASAGCSPLRRRCACSRRPRELGIPTKCHADAWASSRGLADRDERRRGLGRAPDLHARRGDPRASARPTRSRCSSRRPSSST